MSKKPTDPSKPLRMAKHEAFAKAWASGKNLTEAALIAGYSDKRAPKTGHVLGKNRDILARKQHLAQKSADDFTMSRTQWLEELRSLGEEARLAKDYSAAKGCLAEIGKACPGFYAPQEIDGKLEIVIRRAPNAD